MKTKTLIISLYLVLSTLYSFSQTGVRNAGAKIIITSGAYLKIDGANGDYTNSTVSSKHGRIALAGTIVLDGDWTNNATGGDLLAGTSGEVIFDGNSTQQITGSLTTNFVNVQLNEDVEILAPYTVTTNLDLSGGCLILGNNDLTIPTSASITNYGPGKYIRTSGTGVLIQNVNAVETDITYHVGTVDSYMPVILSQASGASTGNFKVRIIDGIWSTGESGTEYSLTDECVDKTWLIETAVGSVNLTMTMQWNASDEVNGFDRTECYISHYETGAWDKQTPISAVGSDPYTVSRTGITSLSPYAVAGDNDGFALPVKLVFFSAIAIDYDAVLNWETASEINNKGFEILHSFNGQDFESVGFVKGNGNSNILNHYEFIDFSPTQNQSGIVYYRLKQIDFNGKFELSKIKDVLFQNFNSTKYIIWPNPTQGKLNIAHTGTSIKRIKVSDLTGKILLIKENDVFNNIDISFLSKGMYLIEIFNGYEVYREKIVLE